MFRPIRKVHPGEHQILTYASQEANEEDSCVGAY